MAPDYEVLELQLQATAHLLAEARRAAHANGQRVVELESELVRVRPVAAAAHAYCAAWLAGDVKMDTHAALFAAHRATTPSQSPPTHVVVAVDELDALRAIADAAGDHVLATLDNVSPTTVTWRNLVAAVDGWKS